jgi:hypothetical protein
VAEDQDLDALWDIENQLESVIIPEAAFEVERPGID